MEITGYGLSDVTPLLQAGFGAAKNELGAPYSAPFLGLLYNGSTGMIVSS